MIPKKKHSFSSNFYDSFLGENDEYTVLRPLISARRGSGMTQQQLSERTGVAQADISRIENGQYNPSLSMLCRLANGLGFRLKLELSS